MVIIMFLKKVSQLGKSRAGIGTEWAWNILWFHKVRMSSEKEEDFSKEHGNQPDGAPHGLSWNNFSNKINIYTPGI